MAVKIMYSRTVTIATENRKGGALITHEFYLPYKCSICFPYYLDICSGFPMANLTILVVLKAKWV